MESMLYYSIEDQLQFTGMPETVFSMTPVFIFVGKSALLGIPVNRKEQYKKNITGK